MANSGDRRVERLLDLSRPLGRTRYLSLAAAAFFSQHLLAWLLLSRLPKPPPIKWWFWLNPLRSLAFEGGTLPAPLAGAALLASLAVAWIIALLSLRRARSVRGGGVWSTFSIVPGLQPLIIAWLALGPRPRRSAEEGEEPGPEAGYASPPGGDIVLSLLLSVSFCVAAVAFSTLVLRTYGYALFVATPFVIGLVSGHMAARQTGGEMGAAIGLTMASLLLGAAALVGLAFEGIVCLVFAAPLIALMGFVGCAIGVLVARSRNLSGRGRLMSVALTPLVLAAETLAPPHAGFESIESIEVAAPPDEVWDSIVHMGPIHGAPAAPFRWGLAYPVRGEIMGRGVGAVRRGVFSTGVAYERVTEWVPARKLSFEVLSDPPAMRELSPYRHVQAPHVTGYFKTLDARFTITRVDEGRTRLTLATRHQLDLEPALYWAPIAQWAVHANKRRVLAHFRRQAETAWVERTSGRSPG